VKVTAKLKEGQIMKRKMKRKEKSLAEQHEQFFVPVPYIPISSLYDLRQPDFRPVVNSVVSGGAAEQPVESWSTMNAKLGRSAQ
jgi:hypothetical protein